MAKENFEITPEQENKYDATKETPQWERDFDKMANWKDKRRIDLTPREREAIKDFIRNLLRQQEEFWELKLEAERAKWIEEIERKKKYVINNYDGDIQRGYYFSLKDAIKTLRKAN